MNGKIEKYEVVGGFEVVVPVSTVGRNVAMPLMTATTPGRGPLVQTP
jgi:hypothetical protein